MPPIDSLTSSSALKGLEHETSVDARTGTAKLQVPIRITRGRGGLVPRLHLSYASGAGNSIAGTGWSLSGLPFIGLDTTVQAPRYDGADPVAYNGRTRIVPELLGGAPRVDEAAEHRIQIYRNRYGHGLRYERWVDRATGDVHWRTRDRNDVVTVYGRSAAHRLADPDEPRHVFSWLAESTHDPTGNAVFFAYLPEDDAGVDSSLAYEAARFQRGNFAQRYPKRIRYGNSTPVGPEDEPPPDLEWHFEVVFDYGDHDEEPDPEADRPWLVRPDAFSSGRAGFEIRTYRLLRRILLFHRFDALGPDPICVGVTRLTHREDPTGTTLVSVDYEGRREEGGTVETRALPPLRLTYSEPRIGDGFRALEPESVENLPAGLTGGYRWVDLYGEGLPGILSEAGGAWFYKPSLGGGRFGPQERVSEAPSFLGAPYVFSDFDRDGNPNLGRLLGSEAGFYEYDRDARHWNSFTPFVSAPQLSADTPVQWVDLNADGLPDLVVPHPGHFTWYPSLGKRGFGDPVDIPIPASAGGGPPLVIQDAALHFYFADMTGDGLLALVRVDCGRVEYWPHLGNGRFGERVVMEGAPSFDHEGTFDPRRIRLTDIDGSGTADLLYLGRGEIRFWINASGNRFVDEQRREVPCIDDLASVQVLDLLADGTTCLVWSSALPGDVDTPIRYLPLTGGVKPRLLLNVDNGMGRELRLSYGTSAAHYLSDRQAGREWITHLPSHVTVVDRREEIDHIGGGRLVSRFEYHDGHFDGQERVFRGFGLVDQYDAEEHPGPGENPELYSDPTCIRTWFHNGVFNRDRRRAEDFWNGDPSAVRLAPPSLEAPTEVRPEEFEDGYRTLAGLVLRQEVYATENGARAGHPLQVTQSTYEVRRLQEATTQHPAAFAAHRTERLDADYAGQPDDPRQAHHLTLEVDPYGVIRVEAHVAYPRRLRGPPGTEAQQELYASGTRTTVGHQDIPERYLIGVDVEMEEFDLFGLTPSASGVVLRESLLADLPAALAAPLDVHEPEDAAVGLRVRRTEWERHFYWNDERTEALPLGQVGTPRLLHHEETACFNDPLVADVYGGRVDAGMLSGDGGYTAADGYWWQPGPTYRHLGRDDFYSVEEEVSPGGGTTRFTLDAARLTHAEVRDPFGNITRMETDYQALAPSRVTDANGTVTETRYDALGVPVLTAVRGSVRDPGGAEHPYGSAPLDEYLEPAPADFDAVLADPAAYLQRTDGYLYYDLNAWDRDGTPPHVLTLAREELVHDGGGGGTTAGPVRVVVSYADGFGRNLQQRQRVEGGPAIQRDPGGDVVVDAEGDPVPAHATERWLVSGHTVYGNKQQPVRQYEPFFSTTAAFEADETLRSYGVAAEHHYDALGQLIRSDFPNGTFARTERTPWLERQYDTNDTVADSAYRADREAMPSDDPERQALDGALAHADTPTTSHFDALAREVLVVETGAEGVEHLTRRRYDGDGPLAEIVDPRGLSAFAYRYDMLGRTLYERSADAGERWTLFNLDGDAVHSWNGRRVHLVTSYDFVGRPTTLHADGALGLDQVIERWTYGEALPEAEAQARNARGALIEHRDEAGVLIVHELTPGGEPLHHSRRLRSDYQKEPDWTVPDAVALDPDTFETRTRYDALGRAVRQETADGTVREFQFLPSGALSRVLLTTAGGELVDQPILESAQYNPRGQRTLAVLGNEVQLDVDYEPSTFRMSRLRARRFETDRTRVFQDIAYTYDPVGNVVRVADAAQQPARPNPDILQGLAVPSDASFTYDAFYRLTEATGRVHQALLQHDYRREADVPHPGALKGTRHLVLNNGAAVERYTRTYRYDEAGNLLETRHMGATRSFTSTYWVSPTSNRRLPAEDLNGIPVTDPESRFDAAGNCTDLPHLRALDWNSRGRLARGVLIDRSDSGGADDAEYYQYDGAGQRRRKITEKLSNGQVEVIEKIYLDGCEIKRIHRGNAPILERHTAHVSDGVNRLALVHRWVRDDLGRETDVSGSVRVHYQLQNHLGSTTLELDEGGGVITYEEYFPYGGTAFLAGDSVRDVRIRDYRYSGKERDDETGFYYYGYRYYAPFIGNWLSPDPLGPVDGLNLYRFVRNNPVTLTDPNGLDSTEALQIVTKVEAGVSEQEAIRQANWNWAFERGIRITNLEPTPDGKVLLVTGKRPLTPEEQARYEEIRALQGSEDESERQRGDLLRAIEDGIAPLLEPTVPVPEDLGGGAAEGGSGEPSSGNGAGDDGTGGGSGAGAQGATGTAADGDAGPSADAGDPSADANHDATGGSQASSGSGPRNATGEEPDARGGGVRGTGPGGGGEDPQATRTGREGRGTGANGRGPGRGSGNRSSPGQAPGGTGTGGIRQGSPGGTRGRTPGGVPGGDPDGVTGGTGPADIAPATADAPGGYDPEGSSEGLPGPPPNGYRPPPPGTLPGGTDPTGSPTGSLTGSPDGTAGDPNGASGQDGEPGSGQGGGGQGGEEAGVTPPQRERDVLDTLVDFASYVTLDALFNDDSEGGDSNGVPGGMGLFDLNLGRWGQVLYVGAALFDLVATILTLGEAKAMMVGARAALKRGLAQLRRLAPLAREALRKAGKATAEFASRLATRSLSAIRTLGTVLSRVGRWLYSPVSAAEEGLHLGRGYVLEAVTNPRATILARFSDVVERGGGAVNSLVYSLGNVERAPGRIISHLEGVFFRTGGLGHISRAEVRLIFEYQEALLGRTTFRYHGLRVPQWFARLLVRYGKMP